MNPTHIIKGKALLVIDAGHDTKGRRTYGTEPYVQTGSGLSEETIAAATQEFSMLDGHVFDVPKRCKKMKDGDRWRLSVAYEIHYIRYIDPHDGSCEWEVNVIYRKVKTLRKQPWNTKRHERYISKANRVKLQEAREQEEKRAAELLSMLGQA